MLLAKDAAQRKAMLLILCQCTSCFDSVSAVAANGNGETADQLKDLFDAISMLPNPASLFGESRDEDTVTCTWSEE